MAKIHRSTTIQATPEAIWEYLAEPTHRPDLVRASRTRRRW